MKRCSAARHGWVGPVAVGFAIALLVSACGGDGAGSTSTSSTSVPASATPTTTSASALPSPSPLTEDAEQAWLGGLKRLHSQIDKVLGNSPTNLTPKVLGSLADQLRGCARTLASMGEPTERLQPVADLARRGCAQYSKAAECFSTAASIGIPVAGTAEERRFNKALDCGFAAPGEGSRLLALAEAKGFEISYSAQ